VTKKPEFRIVIQFAKDQDDRFSLMHRVRNLGEDLWRDFRGEPRVIVELEMVDSAWDLLVLKATSATLAESVAERARILLKNGNLTATVTVAH